jgi:hypothetical protein
MVGLMLALVGCPAIGAAQTRAASPAQSSASASTAEAAPAADEASKSSKAQEGSGGAKATAAAASSQSTATTAPPKDADAAATTGSSADAGATAETLDGATYQIRLRDLEQRVDELKEQIRRSHTRLSLLSDTILAGGVGGARAEIVFVNELSTAFRLIEAVFVLDGAVQYRKQDETGALAGQQTIPIFSGSIPSGDHTLQVLVKLRGHGYGVFSYLRGYQFELRDSHSFTVTDGKSIEVKATAWERGGATTPLEERPAMRYTTNLRTLGEAPAPTPAAKASGKAEGGESGGRVGGGVSVGGGAK